MRAGRLLRFLGLAAIALCGGVATADVPRTFSFQGKLAGYGDAQVDVKVRLYDAASGGKELFAEQHIVDLEDGVFSIAIGGTGGGVPTLATAGAPIWLGVAVNGGAELTPRTRLMSVPFAYKTLRAEGLIVPGTFSTAASVEPDGRVRIGDRVELGAGADGGGLLQVFSAAAVETVRLDGQEPSGGGRIELSNGAASNTATVLLDGNDGDDGVIELNDGNGFLALRLHSDLQNAAPELSLFVGDVGLPSRETVQLAANYDPDSAGAGELRLRRVDGVTQTAQTTVQLAATSDNLLGDPADGAELIMRHSDGSPVFTVHAGDGASAVSPSYMELRNAGSERRFVAQPTSLRFHDSSGTTTIYLGGTDGSATFSGNVTVPTLTIDGGSDLAEGFDVAGPAGVAIEPGLVVCIDAGAPGALRVSEAAYDPTVAGVISGAGGVQPGMLMGQAGTLATGKHPVALTGRVWVWCDAGDAAVAPGDLLTTAATAGHAMKAVDAARRQGAVIGKAMTGLAAGQRGLVLTLIQAQ